MKFIEHKMGKPIISEKIMNGNKLQAANKQINVKDRKLKREIPLRLRLEILQRDNFRCVYCGKSPATNSGTVLHIDHITPYSKGGITKIDNLQLLCAHCNLGKGNNA